MIYLEGNEKYYFWLAMIPGVGTRTIRQISLAYPDLKELFEMAKRNEKLELGMGAQAEGRLSELLYRYAKRERIDDQLEYIYNKDMYVVTCISEEYPELLGEIYNPPPLLFVRGDMGKAVSCGKCFGIVGTRHATRRGIENAHNIARELSASGVCIVSGMASGIDTAAHQGALEGGGPTVAVLGSGVDVIYPKENEALYYKIIENGAVISENVPGTGANPKLFPPRNRIITGISKGILVCEGDRKSGASITANFAVEQNREVFALPADIGLKQGMLPNHLISEGAYICLGADTILECMGWGEASRKSVEDEVMPFQLDFSEQVLYNLLMQGDLTLEELTLKSGFGTAELMEKLTMLEIMGAVEKLPGNVIRALRS